MIFEARAVMERSGRPRFFELTDIPFTRHHIDDCRGTRDSLNASTHIRFRHPVGSPMKRGLL